jgi:hypothetical protein
MPACSYEPHLDGHTSPGGLMPPILYPVARDFDGSKTTACKGSNNRLKQHNLCRASQWRVAERLPSIVIQNHFFKNFTLWYKNMFDAVKTGAVKRYNWDPVFANSKEWAQQQIRALAREVGPSESVVTATIGKLLLAKRQ